MTLMTLGGTNFTSRTILDLLRRDGPVGFSDTELFMRAQKEDSWELPAKLYPKAVADLRAFLRPEEEGYLPIYIKRAVACSMAAGK